MAARSSSSRSGRRSSSRATWPRRSARRARGPLTHPRMVRVLDVVLDDLTGTYWLVTEPAAGITLGELVQPRQAHRRGSGGADAPGGRRACGCTCRRHRPRRRGPGEHPGRTARPREAGRLRHRPPPLGATDPTGPRTAAAAYLAPEVVAGQARDQASDVWSLGATVLSRAVGAEPAHRTTITTCELDSVADGPSSAAGRRHRWRRCSLRPSTPTPGSAGRWPRSATTWPSPRAVVTRRMPVLLPRPTRWQAQDASPPARSRRTAAPRMGAAARIAPCPRPRRTGRGCWWRWWPRSRPVRPCSASATLRTPTVGREGGRSAVGERFAGPAARTPRYSTTTLRPSPSPSGEAPAGSPGPRGPHCEAPPAQHPLQLCLELSGGLRVLVVVLLRERLELRVIGLALAAAATLAPPPSAGPRRRCRPCPRPCPLPDTAAGGSDAASAAAGDHRPRRPDARPALAVEQREIAAYTRALRCCPECPRSSSERFTATVYDASHVALGRVSARFSGDDSEPMVLGDETSPGICQRDEQA